MCISSAVSLPFSSPFYVVRHHNWTERECAKVKMFEMETYRVPYLPTMPTFLVRLAIDYDRWKIPIERTWKGEPIRSERRTGQIGSRSNTTRNSQRDPNRQGTSKESDESTNTSENDARGKNEWSRFWWKRWILASILKSCLSKSDSYCRCIRIDSLAQIVTIV